MLREYSSKERKVEDLLELKVCIDLGFFSGLASHAKEEKKYPWDVRQCGETS